MHYRSALLSDYARKPLLASRTRLDTPVSVDLPARKHSAATNSHGFVCRVLGLNRRLRVSPAPCYAQRMQDQRVPSRYLGSIHDNLVRVGCTRISTCAPRRVLKNAFAKRARGWGVA